jgi:hypothetical protein
MFDVEIYFDRHSPIEYGTWRGRLFTYSRLHSTLLDALSASFASLAVRKDSCSPLNFFVAVPNFCTLCGWIFLR